MSRIERLWWRAALVAAYTFIVVLWVSDLGDLPLPVADNIFPELYTTASASTGTPLDTYLHISGIESLKRSR